MISYFFFQAEDGIRDLYVTGVQTCALPIYREHAQILLDASRREAEAARMELERQRMQYQMAQEEAARLRSEERRVGKECRYRGWAWSWKKKREGRFLTRCV